MGMCPLGEVEQKNKDLIRWSASPSRSHEPGVPAFSLTGMSPVPKFGKSSIDPCCETPINPPVPVPTTVSALPTIHALIQTATTGARRQNH